MSAANLLWSTSSASVAVVDGSGSVRGVAPGTATITAAAGPASSSVTVTVRDTRVSPQAVVVDSTRLRLVSDTLAQARGEYRFSVNGTAPAFSPGQILVGAEGFGYLRAVTSTRQEGSTLVVQTSPAVITDVLKAGRFSIRVPITPGGGTPAPVTLANGAVVQFGAPRILESVAPVRMTAQGFDLSPHEMTACIQSKQNSGCGTVALKFPRSVLSLNAMPQVDWEVDFQGLRKLAFMLNGSVDWDAVARVTLAYSSTLEAARTCDPAARTGPTQCPRASRRLIRVAYPFLAPVGAVPVKGDVLLDFHAELTLTAETSLSLEVPFAMSIPVSAGVDYERGRLPSYGSVGFSGRSTATPSVVLPNVGVGIRAAVKPRLSVRLYNAVAGFVELDPYLRLGLESRDLTNFDAVLAGGVGANVGAEFEIFGRSLASISSSLAHAEWEWQRWTIVGQGIARIGLNPATTSLAIGQSQSLVATAYASDGSVRTPLPPLTWSSSAPAIVGVDGTGRITALAPGRATISAKTSFGVEGTATIDVINVLARPVASVANAQWDGSVSPPRLKLDILAFDANGVRIGNFPVSAFGIGNLVAGGAQLAFQPLSASPTTAANRGPFSVALVIDQSGSMLTSDPSNARITGSRQFVRQVQAGDEAALFLFESSVRRVHDLSGDAGSLDRELTRVGSATGGTALYDAANTACTYVGTSARNANRAVVLLTDGVDGGSSVSAPTAIANCRARGVRVYTIGFAGAPPAVLAQMSMQTGGTATADRDVNVLLASLQSLPVTIRGSNAPTAVDFGVTIAGTLPAAGTTLSGTVSVDIGSGSPLPGTSAIAGARVAPVVTAPFFVSIPGGSTPPVASVQVSLTGSLSVGQTAQATATLRDANGSILTGRQVLWSTSNAAIASVTAAGLVSAVSSGTAVITASSEGRSGSATVSVTQPGGTLLYSDSFESGLANWVPLSGSWTLQSGRLVGEYDISCGSPVCEQGQLLLANALQPTTPDWRAEIEFSQVRYNYSLGYDLTYANAAFSLWVSDTEKLSIGGGWTVNNVAMPATVSQSQYWVQRFYPWTEVTSGIATVPQWIPTQWNTLALEKRGNLYTILFNGIALRTFTHSFSGTPKIGLHVYGRHLMDNFRLTRLP